MSDQKRNTQNLLLGVILMTIPCYCLGFILLRIAPDANVAQFATSPTPFIWTPSPTITPFSAATFTPFAAATPTSTLWPTPTQYIPTAVPPVVEPSTATPTSTDTPVPTSTPYPTDTATPTQTIVVATNTATPAPTATPTGTLTPTVTPDYSDEEPTPIPL